MKDSRTLYRFLLCVLVLLISMWSMQAMAADKGAKDTQSADKKSGHEVSGAKFVGSETCKSCHEDQFKTIQGTLHLKATAPGGGPDADTHACENCHGAGSAHVEGGGDRTKIFTFKEEKADEISQRCLVCHSKNQEHQNFQRSVHNRAGVSCISCHSPHHPAERQKLLSQKTPDLCFGCHTETKADFMKPFRHRVMEGFVKCQDCHNVHSGQLPKQLRATATQEAVCFKCHSDLRGPFVFEHEPVKSEGCSTCHTPHGSTNPRLLTRSRVNSVCLECHQNFYNPPHPQNTKSQACTMCHVAIHGSNSSDVLFKR